MMQIPGVATAFGAVTIVPMHFVAWSSSSCDWVLEPRHTTDAQPVQPFALLDVSPIAFTFAAPTSKGSAIFVQTATYSRNNTCWISCDLIGPNDEIVANRILAPEEIGNNSYTEVLNLQGAELTVGAIYTVKISSQGATEGDCFAVYAIPVSVGRYEHHRRIVRLLDTRIFTNNDSISLHSEVALSDFAVAVSPNWLDESGRFRALMTGLDARFPNMHFEVVELDDVTRFWPILSNCKMVIFADMYISQLQAGITFDALCFALHRLGVATLFYDIGCRSAKHLKLTSRLASAEKDRRSQRRCCHYTLSESLYPSLSSSFTKEALPALQDGAFDAAGLARLHALVATGRNPHVVIVSVLYKKASVVRTFLDHIVQQTYGGIITVVLINDVSPELDSAHARAYAASLPSRWPHLSGLRHVKVVDNSENLGNCFSRLSGIASVEGDIYVVIDCDCLINRDFVAAHVFEHWDPKTDVVIGPVNIESERRDPVSLLRQLEGNAKAIAKEANLQDPVQFNGFVNCITRNFSIKSRLAHDEPLFDTDFAYSAHLDSGFGWEDVEMGYRLYKRDACIQYTPLAFSVHCSHPSSMLEAHKVRGSMRNFLRLFTKHPEMRFAARRWAVDTYDRIVDWADREGVDGGPLRTELDTLFAYETQRQAPLTRSYRAGARRLRVLSYRWHVPHQYELYKLPHDFTLATHLGFGMVDTWAYGQRPLRPNVRMVPGDQLDTRDFDVAILHFDENVLCSELCNGTLPAVWGDPFRRFLAISDLPKVAICHGTPAFEGQYGLDPAQKSSFVSHKQACSILVQSLAAANVKVVCNSWQALAEWGFADARVIWHGFDPQEFPSATYERDILSLQVDTNRPHYRGAWEYSIVADLLPKDIVTESVTHPGASLEHRNGNVYATKHFRSYIDFIRQYKVYLNTTLRSPMPRSRGEAMMTGVVPVCLRNHDVDYFIRQNVNGFYSDDPRELADFASYLCRNPSIAKKTGAEARRTAMDVFNHDRYLMEWTRLLGEVVG